MKKITIFLCLTMFSVAVSAQSWEKPQTSNDDGNRTGLFDRNKTKTIDPKYLEGGVPEVDGKVVFESTINAQGKSANAIYGAVLAHFTAFVKAEGQFPNSQVAIVSKDEHKIVVRPQEWLVFENKALSLDQTKMSYTIIAECKDGECKLSIFNIRYRYEEDRPGGFVVSAEEWITDREALNKKKTGFAKGGVKKFRMKTIDRMEDIFNGVANVLK